MFRATSRRRWDLGPGRVSISRAKISTISLDNANSFPGNDFPP
jgi:hypothetical protein